MIGAQIPPLTPGKWLIGVSIPLLGGWIAAAIASNTDLFMGPFFWVSIYMVVVGIGLLIWAAMTEPISQPRTMVRRRLSAVVLEELASAVAFFFLFSVLIRT